MSVDIVAVEPYLTLINRPSLDMNITKLGHGHRELALKQVRLRSKRRHIPHRPLVGEQHLVRRKNTLLPHQVPIILRVKHSRSGGIQVDDSSSTVAALLPQLPQERGVEGAVAAPAVEAVGYGRAGGAADGVGAGEDNEV